MATEKYIEQSVARLQQIREALLTLEKDEEELKEEFKKYGTEESKRLKAMNALLPVKMELYNEEAHILNYIVRSITTEPEGISRQKVVELAKQLNLEATLREHIQVEAETKGCWTNCTKCVTSCTKCVTSCGLSGQSSGGSCGATTLVSSPCRPKPDIGEQ